MTTGESEKRVVRVTIFQQPYTLRASADPAATEAVARGVDDLMNQIAERTASMDASRVAVMAALHLADKLRAAEARVAAGACEAESKLEALRAELRAAGARAIEAEARETEAEARASEAEERAVAAAERVAELEQNGARADAEQSRLAGFKAGVDARLAALDERLAKLLEEEAR